MELLSGDAIKVGLLVRHASQESWGLGKIVHADSGYVWVYFKDIEGSAKIAVKQLSAAQPRLVRAETQTDLFLDNLPPMVREGRVVPPDAKRLTERQAIQAFVSEYRSFSDPIYVEDERDYKWKAHLQTTDELMSPAGRELVAKGPSEQLSKTLKRLVQLTNLLAVQEFAGLNDAFRDDKAACAYAKGVIAFADGPGETTFSALAEATSSLPAEPGKARVFTWPIVSVLPFLARPDTLMFLKPVQTQRIAETFSFDLLCESRPTWATYQRLLQLSQHLLEQLHPLGARDMIDVQSFMWVVAGAPNMRAAKVTAKSKRASTNPAQTVSPDSDTSSLREHVDRCDHEACVATRKLEQGGASLRLGKGRHCELAVLAAAGEGGLSDPEIVERRRAYAEHLGVTLDGRSDGSVANADYARHAEHVADGNVSGMPDAEYPINIGSAHVVRTPSPDGVSPDRYRLFW